MTRFKRILDPRNYITRRRLKIGGIFVVGFIVLSVVSIQTWEYSNSVSFCSNACHGVHPEEPVAFQDSFHARVKCTECHMGRVGTLESVALKISHFRHLPEVIFGQYGRPTESETLRPANESCEKCHWPPAFHGDTVREIKTYEPDENNTEKRTYLILKTGAGEREGGLGYGIHWHITNPVEYIATDEHKQDIRWVRTTLPDGRTVEYNDVTDPLSEEELDEAEAKVMDCVDCHNRVGHPFPYPERATDLAIADGRLSRDLPYVKKEMADLLSADYHDQETALAAVDTVRERYESTYPEIAAAYYDEINLAADTARALIKRLVFKKPGITWRSFPDSSGHQEFAGCFRCHDGKHLSSEGESIRLHCNICHSIPVTVGEGDRPPEMPIVSVQEPASHLEPNFIADHRFQASDACEACHGEVEFGSDDSSFCANSACHGRAWPEVELDATFTHPIELEGRHAEVWCYNCHEGVTKPEYECANCHQPPTEPHFGQTCEDCHTPQGFEAVDMGDFEHPVDLVGHHAALDCMACHSAGMDLVYDCATCHQPPPDHLEASCDTCHDPQGWAESVVATIAQAPQIPHGLEGMGECLMCHDPAGQTVPAPDDHNTFASEVCTLCHKAAP